MSLTRIPNLTITASVDGVKEPYTLCGDFINTLTNHDHEGNHSVAAEIKRRLAELHFAHKSDVLRRIDFDPEYSQLYIYGELEDLVVVATVIQSMYEEVV